VPEDCLGDPQRIALQAVAGDPLRLGQPAQPQEAVGGLALEELGVGARSQAARNLRSFEGHLRRILHPPVLIGLIAAVDVDAAEIVDRAQLLRDLLGGAQMHIAGLPIPKSADDHAQGVERMALRLSRAHLARDLDRALAPVPGFPGTAPQHQDLSIGGKDAGQLPAGRLRR
jgi:hypothetical protein